MKGLVTELQADQSGVQSFDALTSISSGQVFLWEKIGDAWYGINGGRILKISAQDQLPEFSAHPEFGTWTCDFFRLDDEIEKVFSALSRDPLVASLLAKYPGLRLLRQDPEQCLFSFICASNTNIQMIRRMLYNLTRKFGARLECYGHEFFTFPSASTLNRAPMAELQSCGLGYRARSVKAAAQKITDGTLDLYELRRMGYEEAKDSLLQVYGIGNKIADCILLFSLDKLDAFPIDVWIARALAKHYCSLIDSKIGEKLTAHQYRVISAKMRDHFEKYAGYAQQYLYFDIRQNAGKSW